VLQGNIAVTYAGFKASLKNVLFINGTQQSHTIVV
jgi:hypothetical protein